MRKALGSVVAIALATGCALPAYETDEAVDTYCLGQFGTRDCSPSPNLCPSVNLVNSSGWVGANAALASDNPCGFQGAFYRYGDGRQCCAADSCLGVNPCDQNGCCWSGNTVVDSSYAAWGCGLGLEFGGDGAGHKTAYAGPATCLALHVVGSSGGNKVRITYTQSAQTPRGAVEPFIELPSVDGGFTGTVCFADVRCPPWPGSICTNPGVPYDLQVQVVGGEHNATFALCLTELVPS